MSREGRLQDISAINLINFMRDESKYSESSSYWSSIISKATSLFFYGPVAKRVYDKLSVHIFISDSVF